MSGGTPPHQAPHHVPEYPFTASHSKKEHLISSPFATTYDDGTVIEPSQTTRDHGHHTEFPVTAADKAPAKRRPSLNDFQFDEKLTVAHLPRTLSAHAVGPHFSTAHDPHPSGHFQPPGEADTTSRNTHDYRHTHFQHPAQVEEEELPPAHYHHYTAPTSHPSQPILVNEDELEPFDTTDPQPSAKLRGLDARPHQQVGENEHHLSSHNLHGADHKEIQPVLSAKSLHPAAPSATATTSSSSRPLFSPAEAKKLADHHYKHAAPEPESVFSFGREKPSANDHLHHTAEYSKNHLPHAALGHVTANTVVSQMGNAFLDDEPTIKVMHTESKKDKF